MTSHLSLKVCPIQKERKVLVAHDSYNLDSSSEKAFLMASLLIFRAAVTRPDSGVHGLESNLIFAGISNFSKRDFFASCK